jgi:tetratricopeptide (TPR) repeat protein
MTVNALRQPGPIHRAWGLFVLDHGSTRDAKRVLAKAREEQRERHDVYGDDLVAWSLYRLGRFSDARAASTRALRLGTEDPQLEYHAEMIARASGDSAAAIRHLDRAMRSSSR